MTAYYEGLEISDKPNYSLLIKDRVDKYGDKIALRAKRGDEWESITWRKFGEKINQAAKAMLEMGIEDQQMISVFSQNKPECTLIDIAALAIRAVPVFIYATNTAGQAEYIVNDCQARLIFVGDQEQYDKAKTLFPNCGSLQKIIAFDPNIRLDDSENAMYLSDFLEIGRNSKLGEEIDNRMSRASQHDILTLIYTSGTTGEPKGVILTHFNLIFTAAAHDQRLDSVSDQDVSLCFLPLSHVFERTWTYYALYRGMEVIYLDDPKIIIDFIKEAKPHIMCSVPRVYEKIYAAVYHNLESASPMKKKLFHWALGKGAQRNNLIKDQQSVPLLLEMQYKMADKLVLSKIRDLVGGRIRFMPCAGAPLAQNIEEFFYAAGMFVWYGYGLSETTATVTCHPSHNFKFGLVGTPLPGVHVKIGDNGEILIKGGNVMQGYYNKPEATAEAFTEDGWFRTGDVGEFDENGELRITDRIKDLMKTSGGKYIAPQLIESTLGADHFIEQVMVIGEQKKFVSALIVPSFEALEEYAQNRNIAYSSRADLVQHPEIIELYRQRINERSKELASYEQVKEFTLLPDEFSVDRNEITPTMKIKRKFVAERYNDAINGMYGEM
ncbi:MAG TPA: long-chain fatty acid--CoA ligase [Desulfosalsimonadaceae bacterium]|nr:long-chain fatty acid--CoA ligase [Desulfosalsimonadaceae bacterium]